VGVEHLCEVARSGPAPRRPLGPRPWLHLDRLPSRAPDWTGTPRLKALGLDLPEGFGLKELEQALGAAERPGTEDLATSLEVLGGPEDGRLFTLQPGEWLGRDIPGLTPDHALYTDTPVTDPRLPRRAVEWLGPGRVSLPRAVTRPGGEVVGPGCDRALGRRGASAHPGDGGAWGGGGVRRCGALCWALGGGCGA
jgi:hypothetical protein